MSEKKGPFDRAIFHLNEKLNDLERNKERFRDGYLLPRIDDLKSAIRVLEMARKVDKPLALLVLEQFWTLSPGCLKEEKYKVFCIIRSLLEALPDPEGEKR